jgi:hypothetical protein
MDLLSLFSNLLLTRPTQLSAYNEIKRHNEESRAILTILIGNTVYMQFNELLNRLRSERSKLCLLIAILIVLESFRGKLQFVITKQYMVVIKPLINRVIRLLNHLEDGFFRLQGRYQNKWFDIGSQDFMTYPSRRMIKKKDSRFVVTSDDSWLRFYNDPFDTLASLWSVQRYNICEYLDLYTTNNISGETLYKYLCGVLAESSLYLSKKNCDLLSVIKGRSMYQNSESEFSLKHIYVISGPDLNFQRRIYAELDSIASLSVYYLLNVNFNCENFVYAPTSNHKAYIDQNDCLRYASYDICLTFKYFYICKLFVRTDEELNTKLIRQWLHFYKTMMREESFIVLMTDDFSKISQYFPPDMFTCVFTLKNADRYQLNNICDIVKTTDYYLNDPSVQERLQNYIDNFVEYTIPVETVIKQVAECVTRQ